MASALLRVEPWMSFCVLPKMRIIKTIKAEMEKPDKTFLIFFENFICIIKR